MEPSVSGLIDDLGRILPGTTLTIEPESVDTAMLPRLLVSDHALPHLPYRNWQLTAEVRAADRSALWEQAEERLGLWRLGSKDPFFVAGDNLGLIVVSPDSLVDGAVVFFSITALRALVLAELQCEPLTIAQCG